MYFFIFLSFENIKKMLGINYGVKASDASYVYKKFAVFVTGDPCSWYDIVWTKLIFIAVIIKQAVISVIAAL